jgi:hypothetical protein
MNCLINRGNKQAPVGRENNFALKKQTSLFKALQLAAQLQVAAGGQRGISFYRRSIMAHTVVGVYDDYTQAQKAEKELLESGFPRHMVQIGAAADSPAARRALLRDTERANHQGEERWSVGNFISMIFGNDTKDEHVDIYSEAIRRGSCLLSVDADDDQQKLKAADILNRYDPVDIDERASNWRRDGWSKYDNTAPKFSDQDIERERSAYASTRQENTQANTGSSNRVRIFQRPTGQHTRAQHPSAINTQQQMQADFGNEAADESEYRSHWQSTYGDQGGRYEDYRPAYRYGRTLSSDEKYHGRHWNDIEPEARRDWESKNSDSPWEKVEKAVRFGTQKWRE